MQKACFTMWASNHQAHKRINVAYIHAHTCVTRQPFNLSLWWVVQWQENELRTVTYCWAATRLGWGVGDYGMYSSSQTRFGLSKITTLARLHAHSFD